MSQLARTQHGELPEKGTEGRQSFPLNICVVTVNLKELLAIKIATNSNYLILFAINRNKFE